MLYVRQFQRGAQGVWRIAALTPVIGETLAAAERLAVVTSAGPAEPDASSAWRLTGFTSNVRYVERAEKTALATMQAGLGRDQATHAALIPIKKSDAWWELTQEERRRIFEDQSRHIASSMKYLPAVARQLHHSRDLGEPFDFLTWFEFAPEHAALFEDLVGELRRTEEWSYVTREVDVRLMR